MIQIHQLKCDHHVRWGGFNGEHLHVDHIYYMTHVRPLGLLCSESMSLHARLVKFNLCVSACRKLSCTHCMRTSGLSHPTITWCFKNEELSQRCTLRENTTLYWNFSEGSPYNDTVALTKTRCIKGLTSHVNHKWHDMAMILCFWSPSPKHRHDLHRHRHNNMICIIMISIIIGTTPWSPLSWSPSSCCHQGCRANHVSTTIATV